MKVSEKLKKVSLAKKNSKVCEPKMHTTFIFDGVIIFS